MDDEFLIYLKAKLGERIITTVENADLLLWGVRDSDNVKLLGLTLTIGLEDNEIISRPVKLTNKTVSIIKIAQSISQSIDSVFFVIFYSLSGKFSFKIIPPKNPLDLSNNIEIEEGKMPKAIEDLFSTNLRDTGTAKPVNKSTSDWFHVWTRANLPRDYVKANIDGLIQNEKSKPVIFLETKRSYMKSSSWTPYQADSRNYYLQHLLAKRAGLNFWTIYHQKGISINDSSDVSLFIISKVSLSDTKWISYERFNIKAIEVLELLEKTCKA